MTHCARLGFEVGTADALVVTGAGLLAWAAFASVVQVLVYRRGLRDWDGREGPRTVTRDPYRPRYRGSIWIS